MLQVYGCQPRRWHAPRVGAITDRPESPSEEVPLSGETRRDAPLILTLKMDDESQERFDRLREAHFPPERNHLAAHLTLFHHLPGDRTDEVVREIEKVCARQSPITLKSAGLLFMGRGVAYRLESPELVALRRRLARAWEPYLTRQDQQGLRPHVTVQNKVSPDEARALHEKLEASYSPFEVVGEGLALWRYLGGPWEGIGDYPFRG